MSELTLKLIIILIPGAIATIIYGMLIIHKEWSNFKYILLSTLFGVFSYLLVQIVIEFINIWLDIDDLSLWKNLSNAKDIPWKDVVYATVSAIFLAFLFGLVENKKLMFKVAKCLNISNKYGEEDLFSKFLNKKDVVAVYVRHVQKDITYLGFLSSFAENKEICELELNDVIIYKDKDLKEHYRRDKIYLSFDRKDLIIEVASKNNN